MDIKTIAAVGEASLSAVAEGVAKVREAIPEESRAKAHEARTRAVEAADVAKVKAAEAADVAMSKAAEASELVKEAAAEVAATSKEAAAAAKEATAEAAAKGSGGKVLLGAVLAGAAAGGGYLMWRRRRASAPAEPWPGSGPEQADLPPGLADIESPEAQDPGFAAAVDAEADEIATELVDAVEGHHKQAPEAEGAELAPGLADIESPEAEVDGFAAEVDAAADELSTKIVDAIEEPKK